MINIFSHFMFYGEEFSPMKVSAVTGLSFTNPREPNEFLETGENIPSCGVCSLYTEEDNLMNAVYRLIDTVKKYYDVFVENGMEKMILYVAVNYSGQCNLEFDTDNLKKISDMNASLAISCCEDEELKDVEDNISECSYEKIEVGKDILMQIKRQQLLRRSKNE